MKLLGMIISLSLVVLVVHLREVRSVKFQEVISVVEQRRQELSEHQFIKTIKNESIPLEKRMSFVPYWTARPFASYNTAGQPARRSTTTRWSC